MHALLFGPYPPPFGGVQSHLVALRGYLQKAGLRVSVINLTRHRRTNADDVYYPPSGAAVLALITQLAPDILHVHCGGTLTRQLVGLFLVAGWWPGARSVLTFHSGGYPASAEGRTARRGSMRGFALRQLDHLVGVNEEIRNVFLRYGVPAVRTSVIEPHSGLGASADATAIPEGLRGFAEAHRPLLLTVGLLEPEYNLPLQIEALAELRAQAPAAGLVIVGSGAEAASLRARISASPVGEHVMLSGDLAHDATLALIRQADLLLRTTSYDGDSISIREALQLGTTVLASDNRMRPTGTELLGELSIPAIVDGVLRLTGEPTRRGTPRLSGDENLERVLAVYRGLRPDLA